MNTSWIEYDSRFDVYIKHDPSIYENLEYKIPEIDNSAYSKPFDFIKIINNLLQANQKQITDISHVVHDYKYQCTYDDLLKFLSYKSDFDDIIYRNIVIKGKSDWWICYQCVGLWDYFFISRPTSNTI